jgi:hypothetical protein
LDGASKFIPWKLRLSILMEEHLEKEFVELVDPTPLAAHRKKESEVKIIILDYVTGKKMLDFLVALFYNSYAFGHMLL